MKRHISKEQYDELSDKQKHAAESYYRSQSEPKEAFELFWNVGRMIEYLDEALFYKMFAPKSFNGEWVDIYGFNLSGTLQDKWCDKLWTKVKLTLEEEVQRNPHRFWSSGK